MVTVDTEHRREGGEVGKMVRQVVGDGGENRSSIKEAEEAKVGRRDGKFAVGVQGRTVVICLSKCLSVKLLFVLCQRTCTVQMSSCPQYW